MDAQFADKPTKAPLAAEGQYLSFRLDTENYGIDIMKVQEIRSYEAPTRMPNTVGFFRGVVDLRGVIVPILDLRVRFGCAADFTASTVVIVLDLGHRVVGVVVDAVSDVVTLEKDMVRPAPDITGVIDASAINGLAQVGEGMLILLDIGMLLSDNSLAQAGADVAAVA
jgi:purine-binding chemotaxis protein CheW